VPIKLKQFQIIMTKKKLWILGLGLVVAGAFINGLLIRNDITGLPREGMRLIVLIGIGVFIFGIFKTIKKRYHR